MTIAGLSQRSVVLLTSVIGILFLLFSYYQALSFRHKHSAPTRQDTCCKWNDTILRNRKGVYEVQLCYRSVAKSPSSQVEWHATIEEAKIRVNGSNRSLTFEELATIPDDEWLGNFDATVYNLYPQSTQIKESLKRVIRDLPLLEDPIYNPPIRFLRVPEVACPPLSGDGANYVSRIGKLRYVVLVYKSGVYNFEARDNLRRAYHFAHADVNISLVFSIGLPRTAGGNVFQRDGFNVTLEGRAGNDLLKHSQLPLRTQKMIIREMEQHSDILLGDYEDTYYNLSLKLFHTFQWAARFCRPYNPTFVFLDDDYAVNTPKLVEFIRSKTPAKLEEVGHGFSFSTNPVHRIKSKYLQWAFSKREVPWPRHVPEHLGIYSIWSYRHVHNMALAMHFTKPLVIDDTWLAIVQHKLGLKFTKLDGMYFRLWGRNRLIKCSHLFFAPFHQFVQRGCDI